MLKREQARWLVVAGGLGIAVAPFLVWVRISLLGDMTLFGLTTAADESSALPWAAVAIGVAIAAVAVVSREAIDVRAIAIALGLLAAFYAGVLLVGLVRAIDQSFGLAQLGLGPLVAAASALSIVLGGALVKDAGPKPDATPAALPPAAPPPSEPAAPPAEAPLPARAVEPEPPQASVARGRRTLVSGRAMVIAVVVLALLSIVGAGAYVLGSRGGGESMQTLCHHGYCVSVPSDWSYRDSSPPGQAAYFYWNPDNALEQLTIYAPDCIGTGCLPGDAAFSPPNLTPPENGTNVQRVSPYEIRYETSEGRSPYATEWRLYYPRDASGALASNGAYVLGVDLPDSKQRMAREILDSFALASSD